MAAAHFTHFLTRASRTLRPVSGGSRRRMALGAILPCLKPADPMFYAEWAEGRFALAGMSVVLAGRSPFAVEGAPEAWRRSLHGFDWLRHIPPSVDPNAALHVEALVAEWLAQAKRRDAVASVDGVVARRVLSWLAHADVLLQTDAADHYDDILKALRADIATLQKTTRGQPVTAADGAARLLGLIALVAAGLCIDDEDELLRGAEAALGAALVERQAVVRDPVWRVPQLAADLLLELETLRRLYRMRGADVPVFLTDGVGHLRGLVGALLLGDGSLARLGSARTGADEQLTLWLVARHADVQPGRAGSSTTAGFARLLAGGTCLIADVGAPLAARHALSVEMSSGRVPLLVHDGQPGEVDRDSAGTLVFSAGATEDATLATVTRHVPSLEPAHTVMTEIAAGAAQHVDATHAGHSRRGFVHRRRLTLSACGARLDGVDELRLLVGAEAPASAPFAVRFVLHPTVRVTLGAANDAVVLTAENGHCWRLSAPGHTLSVEGAAYRDGAQTRETVQVLVLADVAASRTVEWQLVREADVGEGAEEMEAEPAAAIARPASLAEALAALVPIAPERP